MIGCVGCAGLIVALLVGGYVYYNYGPVGVLIAAAGGLALWFARKALAKWVVLPALVVGGLYLAYRLGLPVGELLSALVALGVVVLGLLCFKKAVWPGGKKGK